MTADASLARVRRGARALCVAGALCMAPDLFAAVAAGDDDEPPLAPPEAGVGGDAKGGGTGERGGISQRLSQLGVTGSLRGAYWSSNRRFDDQSDVAVGSAWLKLERKLGAGIGLFAEGYLGKEDLFGDERDTSRLREAYVEGRKEQWDFRAGKQIIAWGRTDRLNPTDNLTPRDFTLLVPEIDEDRFGSLAAKATWNLNASTSLTGIWLPEFRPNVIALPSVPGVSFNERIPDSRRQSAVKLDQSGKAIDWSVSWFDGFDLSADLSPGASSPAGRTANLDHNRIRVLGGDAATTRGSYRLAVEAAYTRTQDTDGTNPGVKNPFFYGVFGVERDFTDDLTVILQYFMRWVEHYGSPENITDPAVRAVAIQQAVVNSQYDRTQYGLSARIAKKWLNQTLEGELAAVVLLNRDGYSFRPKLSYAASDSLKLIVGYEYFHGSDKTIYGLLERNKGVFAELRYFF